MPIEVGLGDEIENVTETPQTTFFGDEVVLLRKLLECSIVIWCVIKYEVAQVVASNAVSFEERVKNCALG